MAYASQEEDQCREREREREGNPPLDHLCIASHIPFSEHTRLYKSIPFVARDCVSHSWVMRKLFLVLLLCVALFGDLASAGAQKTDKGCNKCEKNKTPPEKKQPQAFQTCEVWQQQGVPDNSCPAVDPSLPPSPPGVPSADCHVDNNMECSKKEQKKGTAKADKHNTNSNSPSKVFFITLGILVFVIFVIVLASWAIYQMNVQRSSVVAVNLIKNA